MAELGSILGSMIHFAQWPERENAVLNQAEEQPDALERL